MSEFWQLLDRHPVWATVWLLVVCLTVSDFAHSSGDEKP